ncbi:YqgE/AlgH family protein [Myxococcus sp. K38C18041901]|uniref:YqgE/AlgH family protein n=1 Tax=Myxococcus guangdongensis TaxID=2906760 RepID=UPI0020A74F46|nr:YqgE/AlgH family protein [Myxococcus guangdongensis]MCP3063857.1 YqgE/AlgH family protein [Myxococcus guangdongensis]
MKRHSRWHLGWVLMFIAAALLVLFPRAIDALKSLEQLPAAPLRAGSLLVSRPGRVSENFDETVVLLLDAGAQRRTWGVVLNRVRNRQGELLPQGVDRWGGPVNPALHITLTLRRPAPEGAQAVLDGITWYEGRREAHLPIGDSLTFEGVSAWAPGQLEEEVARGAWWVLEGQPADVFTAPGSLWEEHAVRHL